MIKYIIFAVFAIGFATVAFGLAILISKYAKLLENYVSLNKFLKNLLSAVASARWGNLKVRLNCDDTKLTSDVSKALNGLFESVQDRDTMILEYVEKEKENNSIVEDFVAMLTHDLKVPIIAQDNTLDLLLDGKFGELNENQKYAIKNIKISNLDLKHLVESLLDSHSFKKKGFKLKYENFNLRKFVDGIISQISNVAALHGKTIRLFDYLEPDLKVVVDKLLLKRIILNFVLNAISYGANSEYIDVILKNSKKDFSIGIKDYGNGISKEDMDKIFNKYYSAAQVYSKVSTGLGLYLSNKIAAALSGKIEAESSPNNGATFTIVLPLK